MRGPIFFIKKFLAVLSINKKNKSKPFDIEAADSMHALPSGVSAAYNNSWYFMAHDDKGAVLIFRLGYRGDGRCEIWFYFAGTSGEEYKSKSEYLGNAVKAGVKTELAGKNLTFFYEDDDIRFDGAFAATEAIFEFSRDILPTVLARAVAEEKWDNKFRESSDLESQVHYEQTGVIRGTLTLKREMNQYTDIESGKGTPAVSAAFCAPAVRDHSFGERDWGHMERHFWLCAVNSSQTLCYNSVSYPRLRNLKTGYFIDGYGRTLNIIDGPGLEVFSPEEPKAPEELSLSLTAEDGSRVSVSLLKKHEIIYAMGDGVYCICEGIGEYDIGGRAAKGIIEFGYRADSV